MRYWLATLLAIILYNPVLSAELELSNKVVHICDDGAEWPPFTYYERENGVKTSILIGYSVDIIREIFNKHNVEFDLKIVPWKRCQVEVEHGKRYQMFLSGVFSAERNKKYHVTQIYYYTKHHYFWSLKKYPKGLTLRQDTLSHTLFDLVNKYDMGSIHGYGLGTFEANGIDTNRIDSSSPNYQSLEKKLMSGRIDVFHESLEVLDGLAKIGDTMITKNPEIGHAPIPGMSPRGFHMMISKKYVDGLLLKNLIMSEIEIMKTNGRLDDLWEKYFDSPSVLTN
ncbi:MAG: transporter substrate-binding domain-containing protein [Halopseudomonas aestusnigri]